MRIRAPKKVPQGPVRAAFAPKGGASQNARTCVKPWFKLSQFRPIGQILNHRFAWAASARPSPPSSSSRAAGAASSAMIRSCKDFIAASGPDGDRRRVSSGSNTATFFLNALIGRRPKCPLSDGLLLPAARSPPISDAMRGACTETAAAARCALRCQRRTNIDINAKSIENTQVLRILFVRIATATVTKYCHGNIFGISRNMSLHCRRVRAGCALKLH